MNVLLFSEIAKRPLECWYHPQDIIVIYRNRSSWRCDAYSVLARKIAKSDEVFQTSEINSLRTVLGYIVSKFDTDILFFQGSDWTTETESLLVSVFGKLEISLCPLVLVPDCSKVGVNDN